MPRPSGKAAITLKGNAKNLPDSFFREFLYGSMPRRSTMLRILPNAATHCSEKGIWSAKEKLLLY